MYKTHKSYDDRHYLSGFNSLLTIATQNQLKNIIKSGALCFKRGFVRKKRALNQRSTLSLHHHFKNIFISSSNV